MADRKIKLAGVCVEEMAVHREAFWAREERTWAERERLRQEVLKEVQQAVCTVASRYPVLCRVYLFGSVIRPGAFRPDSDIDVAVDGLDMGACFDLWRDLERAMPGWTLDVRALSDADSFSERVRQRGILVYERNCVEGRKK